MAAPVVRWSGFVAVGAMLLLTLSGSIAEVGLLGNPAAVVALILAEVFALLIAFRVHPMAYVALAALVGVSIGAAFDRISAGFIGFAAACVVLAFANYLVKLVIDHSYERKLLVRRYSFTAAKAVMRRAAPIWLWAAAFAALGFYAHWEAERALKQALYQSRLVTPSPCDARPPHGRDIHADVRLMLQFNENDALHGFANAVANADRGGAALLRFIPDLARTGIERVRPSRINVRAACSGVTRWFAGLCGWFVRAIDDSIQAGFDRASAAAHDALKRRSDGLIAQSRTGKADALEAGTQAIKGAYETQRTYLRYTFVALELAEVVSYIILLAGLVAALQMVMGRVLFDANENAKFRLGPADDAAALNWSKHDVISLEGLALTNSTRPLWYLQHSVSRSGTGTHEDLCVPQFPTAFLQRLFSGRLLMTRVRLDAAGAGFPPKVSLPGDLKLVQVRIEQGQQVCFRMRDLAGFSAGIVLRSVYSTHVGAHLLGLAAFHTYAEGDGYLLLISEGQQLEPSKRGLPTPAATILAWDRRHEFALEQRVSSRGVWLNEPSLVLASADGAAILDESEPVTFGLARRIWRLFRYLLLPF